MEADPTATLRRAVYAILMTIGAAGIAARIAAVDGVDFLRLEPYLQSQGRADWKKRMPFLSANDRSRWLTVRALVERGTYRIDELIAEPNWDSIDVVKHDDEGRAAPAVGQGHFYSSKPPLLATLVAGEYWLVYHLTGYSLGTHPHGVGKFLLATINVPLFVLLWSLLVRYVERYGRTDFGRVFTVAAGVFGTLLTALGTALNNHLVAAAAAMATIDAVVRIAYEGDLRLRRFAQAGLAAAFTAANELPALSFFAITAAGLLWKFPRPTLRAFAPAAAVVAAAALGTNYAAHGTFAPAYSQRNADNNWYEFQYVRDGVLFNSYWSKENQRRSGVDKGEPSAAAYAFHALVGHHGIFLLTPVWLLTAAGQWRTLRDRHAPNRALAASIALTSIVCIVFYLTRPQIDRNYGGSSCGFRWVFWFAPLWLVGLLPAADACDASRGRRIAACLLLGASVFSVAFPTWNPWTHPWATQIFLFLNWGTLGGE